MVIYNYCKILCYMGYMCEYRWSDIYLQPITINALPLTNYIMWQTFVHHCIITDYASGKVGNADPLKEHSMSAERAWRAKSVARASEPPASVASKVPCLLSSFSADWALASCSLAARWLLAGYSLTTPWLLTGYSLTADSLASDSLVACH